MLLCGHVSLWHLNYKFGMSDRYEEWEKDDKVREILKKHCFHRYNQSWNKFNKEGKVQEVRWVFNLSDEHIKNILSFLDRKSKINSMKYILENEIMYRNIRSISEKINENLEKIEPLLKKEEEKALAAYKYRSNNYPAVEVSPEEETFREIMWFI